MPSNAQPNPGIEYSGRAVDPSNSTTCHRSLSLIWQSNHDMSTDIKKNMVTRLNKLLEVSYSCSMFPTSAQRKAHPSASCTQVRGFLAA
jgi:hypothetical protein